MTKGKCKVCKGKAVYREGPSPSYYFCSIAHHKEFNKRNRYISYGLERIDGKWSAGIGLPFDLYELNEELTLNGPKVEAPIELEQTKKVYLNSNKKGDTNLYVEYYLRERDVPVLEDGKIVGVIVDTKLENDMVMGTMLLKK